jgi:hypothetical protein
MLDAEIVPQKNLGIRRNLLARKKQGAIDDACWQQSK